MPKLHHRCFHRLHRKLSGCRGETSEKELIATIALRTAPVSVRFLQTPNMQSENTGACERGVVDQDLRSGSYDICHAQP